LNQLIVFICVALWVLFMAKNNSACMSTWKACPSPFLAGVVMRVKVHIVILQGFFEFNFIDIVHGLEATISTCALNFKAVIIQGHVMNMIQQASINSECE